MGADDLTILFWPAARALMFSCLLIIGVWSLKGAGRFFSIGVAFVVAGGLLNVLAVNLLSAAFLYRSFAALFGFLLIAISCTLKQIVVGTEISANRLDRSRLYIPASRRNPGGCLQRSRNYLSRLILGASPRWGIGDGIANGFISAL